MDDPTASPSGESDQAAALVIGRVGSELALIRAQLLLAGVSTQLLEHVDTLIELVHAESGRRGLAPSSTQGPRAVPEARSAEPRPPPARTAGRASGRLLTDLEIMRARTYNSKRPYT